MTFPAESPRNWLDQYQYGPDVSNNTSSITQDSQGNIYYGSASMYSWGPPNGPATWINLTTGQVCIIRKFSCSRPKHAITLNFPNPAPSAKYFRLGT